MPKLTVNKASKAKINPVQLLKDKQASLADRLTEEIEELGVVLFEPEKNLNIDTDYVTLPRDITEVVSHELGQYLNAMTQQKMYMRTLIGWQLINLEESKREYFDVSEDIYKDLSRTKQSETSKERIINCAPDVKPKFLLYKDQKRKLDLLELNLASIEDAIFQVSREISRRNSDWDTENRNHNVSRR